MKGKRHLRVMTFNVHGGRPESGPVDLRAIAAVIRQANPEVVGVQELHRRLPPPYDFQDQPLRLRRLLDMEVIFRSSFGLGQAGFGNALLSWVRLEQARTVRLPWGASWKALEPRTLLEGRLKVGSHSVRILNTHLGLNPTVRCRQVRRIVNYLSQCADPVVLMGDLNAQPHSEELRILKDAGLTDAAPANVVTFPSSRATCRLDYILVSSHFEVTDCFAIDTEVSDHRPVVAGLLLR